MLTTVYAAGLRVSEAIALRVTDIDADRMTMRIAQGKGAKDRYVPLAARLRHDLRAYWTTTPPLASAPECCAPRLRRRARALRVSLLQPAAPAFLARPLTVPSGGRRTHRRNRASDGGALSLESS